MSRTCNQVEVLTFRNADHFATVVTDGARTKSFEVFDSHDHPSLQSAIAHLEAKGYSIITEIFHSL